MKKLSVKLVLVFGLMVLSFIVRMFTYFVIGAQGEHFNLLLNTSFVLFGLSLLMGLLFKKELRLFFDTGDTSDLRSPTRDGAE
jgi:hypothetical protein